MGAVIYEASPLQAFLGSFGTILVLGVLGVAGIGMAVFRPRQGRGSRIVSGVLGVFLLTAGCVLAAITFLSFASGARTVTLSLDDKTVATDNCGDNGGTCTRYVLSATTGTNAYDFDVPSEVYDQAQLNSCYQITYYPNTGLPGLSSDSSSYQRIDNITRIALADPAACP
ncbi:MAG TPA: hypothetical protein VLX61_12940 [Anaerolineales bacterium]|nr:hypothetical protein [Anaerolineales bacterium]